MNFEFLSIEGYPKITEVKVKGVLIGHHQLNELLPVISEYIENEQIFYILNLAELEMVNSTGLSIFITLLTKSRNAGGEVILCNMPEQLSKLLVITKLHTIFMVQKNMEEAIEYMDKIINKEYELT